MERKQRGTVRQRSRGWIECDDLYCTERALWKLHWFLKEFNYDPKLLDQDEIDEKAILGLRGVVKISRASVNGRRVDIC